MANTYFVITNTILTSTAASITLSSIPTTYTDLLLKTSTRVTGNAGGVYLTFNGSSTSYQGIRMQQNGGTSWQSDNNGGLTDKIFTIGQDTRAGSSYFQAMDFYIPRYQDSINHACGSHSVSSNNTTAYAYNLINAPLWSNASPITSITLTPEAGSFAIHSSVILYGIKNS